MNNFEKIKLYYEKGIYKEKHLKTFLAKGVISKEEYNQIVGAYK